MALNTIDFTTPDNANQGFQKLEANDIYLEQLIINNNKSVENRYITPPNNVIATMIANQANQTDGKFQYVGDASADPDVASGGAYYEYKGTTNGDLTDYRRLSDTEVVSLISNPNFNVFELKSKEVSYLSPSIETGLFLVEFENVNNKITYLYFDAVFTKYLLGFDELSSTRNYEIKLYNKTAQSTHIANVTSFELIQSSTYIKVGIETIIDESDFNLTDVIQVDLDVVALGSSGLIVINNGFDWSNIPASYADKTLLIRGAFDLAAGDIVLPKNVHLQFDGGSISNYGTITFDNTIINASYQVFDGSGAFAGVLLSEVHPEWFGAVAGDDTVDDRDAFQYSLNMINDIGGGILRLTGNYYLDSRDPTGFAVEVFSNTSVVGDGIFKSRVKLGDAVPEDTPIFITNSASNVEFARFEIDGNRSRHSSTGTPEDEGIDIKGGMNVTVRNMFIHDCFTDAIDFDQVANVGADCMIINNIIKDCGGYAIHNNFSDSVVQGNVIVNCGHERYAAITNDTKYDVAGIDVRNSNAVVTGNVIKDCIKGIALSQGNKVIVSNNLLEGNGEVGIGLGSIFLGSQLPNTTISDNVISNQLIGIEVVHTGEKTLLSNNNIQTNGTNNTGIKIIDALELEIFGGVYQGFYSVLIQGNSGSISVDGCLFKGTQTGVRIETGVNDVLIQNCKDDLSSGVGVVDLRGDVSGTKILNNVFTNRQAVRMLNSGGTVVNTIIKNNETKGMTILGSTHEIERNSGYITEAKGEDSIVSGNANVVVNHGMNITPNIVVVTPQANQMVWVVNVNSTSFQVNRAVTAGTLTFNWIAQ